MNAPTSRPSVPSNTNSVPTTSVSEAGNLKVQIASYKNLKFFKRAAAEKLGQIETRRKGEFTIILLSGFNNKESAETARLAAVQAGYSGAFLVKDKGGVLEKIP